VVDFSLRDVAVLRLLHDRRGEVVYWGPCLGLAQK
jgi:hypothetical protein